MRSPLKSKPLSNPGQSLDRYIDTLFFNGVDLYLVVAASSILIAMIEWVRWFSDPGPNPILFTAIAVVVSAFCAWRIRSTLMRLKRVRLGRDGERAVGQYLERLRADGAHVFHDILGDKFNIDHAIVHRSGIYVIETKTYSKPDHGEAKLLFDGKSITRDGRPLDRDPIVQITAAAAWLLEQLAESTGRKFKARPVIVFPGWFIELTAEAKTSDVWVMNPRMLPAFISRSNSQISEEDVSLCAYHLSRYIRSTQK